MQQENGEKPGNLPAPRQRVACRWSAFRAEPTDGGARGTFFPIALGRHMNDTQAHELLIEAST